MRAHSFISLCLYSGILIAAYFAADDVTYACDREIFCRGDLLTTVQRARLFPDSKTFVDMNLRYSSNDVLAKFSKLRADYNQNIPKSKLREFIESNFNPPGEEMLPWIPSDLARKPPFLDNITDPQLADFAWNLCRIWGDLGRKIKPEVALDPERYSLIHLPNPFIVPGGRFREIYYWDSYWVIRGLITCNMIETAAGMLENFAFLIKKFGFIPNGSRVYYTRRAQPPFFTSMVYDLFKATGNVSLIREHLPTMEQEYTFWMHNRSVEINTSGGTYTLNRYYAPANMPRPESYFEDEETLISINSDTERRKAQQQIVSACETGWDFSSRWFNDVRGDPADINTQNRTDPNFLNSLKTTHTSDVIPVDLNSILFMVETMLSEFHHIIGNKEKSQMYKDKQERRRQAINSLLWNDDVGMWQDYSLSQHKSRNAFYASHLFPLYSGCISNDNSVAQRQLNAVHEYIKTHHLPLAGGIPTSLLNTGQQWDFPNAWPPLQHIWIIGLDQSKNKDLQALSQDLLKKWVSSNLKAWRTHRAMLEKYSAINPGTHGGGGEYVNQEGFGWTNGVILDLLNRYNRLKLEDNQASCHGVTSGSQTADYKLNIMMSFLVFYAFFCKPKHNFFLNIILFQLIVCSCYVRTFW